MIKMRIVNDRETHCSECGIRWQNTKEMYQIMLFGQTNYICYECVDKLFHKTLSAQCKYNEKVKSKEDLERIKRSNQLKEVE